MNPLGNPFNYPRPQALDVLHVVFRRNFILRNVVMMCIFSFVSGNDEYTEAVNVSRYLRGVYVSPTEIIPGNCYTVKLSSTNEYLCANKQGYLYFKNSTSKSVPQKPLNIATFCVEEGAVENMVYLKITGNYVRPRDDQKRLRVNDDNPYHFRIENIPETKSYTVKSKPNKHRCMSGGSGGELVKFKEFTSNSDCGKFLFETLPQEKMRMGIQDGLDGLDYLDVEVSPRFPV